MEQVILDNLNLSQEQAEVLGQLFEDLDLEVIAVRRIVTQF